MSSRPVFAVRVAFAPIALALIAGSVVARWRSADRRPTLTAQRPGYPHGAWRLAPGGELEHVVIWVSHILIRHRDAEPREAPFAAAGWKVQPAPPQRTRAEARARAEELCARARQNHADFAALARAYSEDTLSSDRGGSLGGIPASRFVSHPEFLDALAQLKPGEVSEVLESPYGFHVLLRREPPPEQIIAARRIVIGHADAPWLDMQRRESLPAAAPRSRAAARELAAALSARVLREPAQFERLVREYSEARDAEHDGDIGVWSNREPSPLARQLERLSELSIGEVAEPIETQLGFEILQRVAAEPRASYGMLAIRLRFDPVAADGAEYSRKNVRSRADSLARTLRGDPAAFDAVAAQYRARNESWTEGRGDPALTALLQSLAIGELAPAPIAVGSHWVIAKRVEPAPPAVTRFELPSPATADLNYLVSHVPPRKLAAYTRQLRGMLDAALPLAAAKRRTLATTFDQLADAFEYGSPEQRVEYLQHAQATLQRSLGAEEFARFTRALHQQVKETMLR